MTRRIILLAVLFSLAFLLVPRSVPVEGGDLEDTCRRERSDVVLFAEWATDTRREVMALRQQIQQMAQELQRLKAPKPEEKK